MQTTKYVTVTPKDFKKLVEPHASEIIPTGVWNYQRVSLVTLLPQLGQIKLSTYYHLRIACCAYLQVEGERLRNCGRCHDNHGYVCPICLGSTWTDDRGDDYKQVRCPGCCFEFIGEKGKIESKYDPERELLCVQRWLAKRFPYGVPHEPTEDDLRLMDGVGRER